VIDCHVNALWTSLFALHYRCQVAVTEFTMSVACMKVINAFLIFDEHDAVKSHLIFVVCIHYVE